jgi:general secretion pathway protein A
MYCEFFGFSERPFEVTPDPKFLYLTPGHREILASLIYGIRERRGFTTMVGEPGIGKTILLKSLLDWLGKNIKVAFIFHTDVTFVEMITMALIDLGLATAEENLSKVGALQRLNEFATQQLAKGGNVALIVDEAQNLDRRVLENLRLLSNMETRKHKLIQIVFSGQPELEAKLSQPELRQLAQRISLKRYVVPLTEKETYEYIQHRLAIANCDDQYLFNLRAKQLAWLYSGGVPRMINILCDNALLIGFRLKEKRIKGHMAEEVIKDLGWRSFSATVEAQDTPP